MFSPKSPQNPSKHGSKLTHGPGEEICMVDCGCKPDCTCSLHLENEMAECAAGTEEIDSDVGKQGFVNLAYKYGSEGELCPPSSSCRATFKFSTVTAEHQLQAVQSRVSRLRGVLSASTSLSSHSIEVRYDTTVTTSKEIGLQLHNMGHSAESTVHIRVDGIHCQSCVQTIEANVGSLQGVSHIQVSLQSSSALIVFHSQFVTQQELKDKIEDLGFDATLMDGHSAHLVTVTVWITGMTCSSCVESIEGRISRVTGVISINVSLKEQKGTVTFNSYLTEAEQLRAAIEDMGFEASLKEPAQTLPVYENSRSEPMFAWQSPHETGVSNNNGSLSPVSSEENVHKCFFAIAGMTCASCVANIERQLLKHKGILTVLVSLMAGKAEVKYNSDVIDTAAIKGLIEDLGFGAKLIEDNTITNGKLDLTITGMTCASCVHTIESTLTATNGILGASVVLVTKKAQIQFEPEVIGARDIINIIQDLGFEASLVKEGIKNNLDHREEIKQQVSDILTHF